MTSKFIDFTKDKITTRQSSPEKTTDRTTFQNKTTKSVDVDQNPPNSKTPFLVGFNVNSLTTT